MFDVLLHFTKYYVYFSCSRFFSGPYNFMQFTLFILVPVNCFLRIPWWVQMVPILGHSGCSRPSIATSCTEVLLQIWYNLFTFTFHHDSILLSQSMSCQMALRFLVRARLCAEILVRKKHNEIESSGSIVYLDDSLKDKIESIDRKLEIFLPIRRIIWPRLKEAFEFLYCKWFLKT